jgi:predicted exporter
MHGAAVWPFFAKASCWSQRCRCDAVLLLLLLLLQAAVCFA